MNFLNRFLIFILVFFLCFSCGTVHEKELKDVASLKEIVQSTEDIFLSVDTSEVFPVVRKVKQEQLALAAANSQILSGDELLKLGDYLRIKKSIELYCNNYETYRKELSYAAKQLNTMYEDVDHNVMDMKKFPGYYEKEQQAVSSINSSISSVVQSTLSYMTYYDSSHVLMESMIAKVLDGGDGEI